LVVSIFSVFLIISLVIYALLRDRAEPVEFRYYKTLLDNSLIERAVIKENYIFIYTKNAKKFKIVKDAVDTKELYKKTLVEISSVHTVVSFLIDVTIIVILLLSIFLFLRFDKKSRDLMRNSENRKRNLEENINKIRKLEAQNIKKEDLILSSISDVTFDDVAGFEDTKEELEEIIDFLKNPEKYREFGLKLPKGVLMIGPPGVGKTLLAKAVAGEADVPFFYQSGASFVHIYVGVGSKKVSELFKRAKENAPSIVFIDEIDAVGKARSTDFRNDERDATLNQLLTEMDGFEDSSEVIVIGATNRIEMLDDALLRAGRFDRRIHLSLPTYKDRVEIIQNHLRGKFHSVDIEKIAKMTIGFSGASIGNLVNEAGLYALKNDKKRVELDDFLAVKDKVMFGKKTKLLYSEKEKEILSYYQGAKALCAYWYDIGFEKILLIADEFEDSEKELVSKTEMLSKIRVYISGVVALKLVYNESFSNSRDDLKVAKEIARKLFDYGMTDSLTEVNYTKIVDELEDEVKEFLTASMSSLEKIQKILLLNEEITKNEIREIVDEPI
jgi:ATP-dependent metalloprotease FtsH